MAEIKQIYKCERCGIIVETLHGGGGELTCCHAPMVLLESKTADSTTEKHVPVIEKIDGGYKVTVGSTLHPMEEKHQIEWIELIADEKVYREYLKVGENPEVIFKIDAKNVSAREYCNLHGLWKA